MHVLLATPEIDPLTGSTPLGRIVRGVAGELENCPEVAFTIAAPATEALLAHIQPGTITKGSGEEIPDGRIHRLAPENGPTLFLLESPGLAAGFDSATTEADRSERACLWARMLLELVARLNPEIHLAHAFGWESSLLPVLLRAEGRSPATVFSNPAARGSGPALHAALEAARRTGAAETFPPAATERLHDSIGDVASKHADAIDPLEDFADAAAEPRTADSTGRERQESRTRLLAAYDLEDGGGVPLILVPTRNPETLLPILPRLLETGACVLLVSPPGAPATEARLSTCGRRHPRRFARIPAAPGPTVADRDLDLAGGADLLLLLPSTATESGDWAIAQRGIARGCLPIVPRRSIPSNRHGNNRDRTLAYRNERPEAIWAALKGAIALYRHPDRWRTYLSAHSAPAVTDDRPHRLADLYRDAITPVLKFS